MAFGVVACGGDDNNDSGSSGSGGADTGAAAEAPAASGGAAEAVKKAKATLDVAMKGHMTAPPTTDNPAFKGGNLWIIESYGASPSVSIPAKTAKEAATKLGWKSTVYDAKGDPGNYVKGISTAIANGANGIILVAIDCSYVKNQLAQAKAKKIAVSEVYAFDCDDTNPGQEAMFTADLSFGKRWPSLIKAWNQWGADTAAWIIANTGGEAKPLILRTDQIAVLRAWQDGFDAEMAKCGSTCKTVNQPWNTVTDITPAAIASLMKNAALQHPEINSSAFGSTVTSGYNQGILAMGEKGKSLKVMAGLGLPDEFALIRKGQGSGLNATTAWPQEWIAYAAIDSINSVLNGKETEDEGIGWQVVDNTNKEAWPPAGQNWQGDPNFRDDYAKRWGVGGAA